MITAPILGWFAFFALTCRASLRRGLLSVLVGALLFLLVLLHPVFRAPTAKKSVRNGWIWCNGDGSTE